MRYGGATAANVQCRFFECSMSNCWQRGANALREIRRVVGRLRRLGDPGAPPQLIEWQ
jgi:hypothetical protein